MCKSRKLTIIAGGRDDDYEFDFIDRLNESVSTNVANLEKSDINKSGWEYILVEWAPFRNCFYYNEKTKHLFNNKRVKNLVVDISVPKSDGLNTNTYFEYFAKNAAIRRAIYDTVLVTNADIIFPPTTLHEISQVLNRFNPTVFYRAQYRRQVVRKSLTKLGVQNLHNPAWSDAVICGAYSGDFLLCDTDTVVMYGEGYDETSEGHRSGPQTGMDGEILWNLHNKGIKLSLLPIEYWHILHSKNTKYNSAYRQGVSYANRPYWGFCGPQYFDHKVNDQLTIIKA